MIEIDFEALKHADFEVINSRPTKEEFSEISAFLKKRREEQARLEAVVILRSKKTQPLPAARKNARATAK